SGARSTLRRNLSYPVFERFVAFLDRQRRASVSSAVGRPTASLAEVGSAFRCAGFVSTVSGSPAASGHRVLRGSRCGPLRCAVLVLGCAAPGHVLRQDDRPRAARCHRAEWWVETGL